MSDATERMHPLASRPYTPHKHGASHCTTRMQLGGQQHDRDSSPAELGAAHLHVAAAAVAADLLEALNVQRGEAAQVALHAVFLDFIAELRQLLLAQVPRPLVLDFLWAQRVSFVLSKDAQSISMC